MAKSCLASTRRKMTLPLLRHADAYRHPIGQVHRFAEKVRHIAREMPICIGMTDKKCLNFADTLFITHTFNVSLTFCICPTNTIITNDTAKARTIAGKPLSQLCG